MDFTTEGMTLSERYELLEQVNLIPTGIICYEAGDFTEWTKEIIVTKENQKRVTMFWNCLFFLDKEKADYVTNKAHAEYAAWLYK